MRRTAAPRALSYEAGMNDDTLERLETKIAFLERAIIELSDEVYRQRQELDALRARVAGLERRVAATASEAEDDSARDQRPPHY
jgi:SlyX protein